MANVGPVTGLHFSDSRLHGSHSSRDRAGFSGAHWSRGALARRDKPLPWPSSI